MCHSGQSTHFLISKHWELKDIESWQNLGKNWVVVLWNISGEPKKLILFIFSAPSVQMLRPSFVGKKVQQIKRCDLKEPPERSLPKMSPSPYCGTMLPPWGGSLMEGEIRWQLKARVVTTCSESLGHLFSSQAIWFSEKNRILKSGDLGLNPCSAMHLLCGLGHVMWPLWASSLKHDNNLSLSGLLGNLMRSWPLSLSLAYWGA